MKIPYGAVVYVSRQGRKHFGIHLGQGLIAHFSNKDPDSYNRNTPIIHKVSLAEFLGKDTDEILELVKNRKNKSFYYVSIEDFYRAIVKDYYPRKANPLSLVNILNPLPIINRLREVEVVTHLKQLLTYNDSLTLDNSIIVNRAKKSIGCNHYNEATNSYEYKKDGYGLLTNNCEHFATWCVTGKHMSTQTNDPSCLFETLMGVDYYRRYCIATSFADISDTGKYCLLLYRRTSTLERIVKNKHN